MRKIGALSLMAACLAPYVCGQKLRYGQTPPKAEPGVSYPIKVHISSIHVRSLCSVTTEATCEDVAYAEATANGEKIELMGNWYWDPKHYQLPLTLGDHQGRLLKNTPKAGVGPLYRKYELLLADRTVWPCTVTGISE
ncbi:MAG TPA: hypothetical protein VGR47_12005 [Terracidiphilus sp.]|nr:hypothetical protein [Terracidiphilus sp.]